ncbi:TonB-dependent receptor [Duganella sp. Root1480D1]|uniref:TonB-dependent receptor n=1 Tax=Duganella sp. Root1480D1 TaxID=1736471 RepID=UPI0007108661|nr:TonB-dependent receptor [Duganella sp. Root1480D1]KQZ40947.1 TonB-dependent receptor [Duganella sp. Root1480D1]
MNTRLIPLAAALLAVFSAPAFADHEGESPLKMVGTVVIAGNHPTSLPTQIPTTIEGITRTQIEEQVNASDAEDALKYLPSLLVRKRYIGDYNHAVLSTRASGTGNSARSAVYADGVLLSNYLGNGATFAPRWGMVAPEEIERVDVLYGPFSAAYGGNSVGAVVDYVTRMPKQFEAHARVAYVRQPFELYNTNMTSTARQSSMSLGDRHGAWSWFISVNRTDSDGQPQTYTTRAMASGTLNGKGVPVSGAVADKDRTNRDIYVLGTATQYNTVQDHAKIKLAYDFSPTVRASYSLGWWQNDSSGSPNTYLRDVAGKPVFSGPVLIDGRSFTLAASDFNSSKEELRHVMHGLTVKSNTKGVFDWEVAASLYDYSRDILRAPTTARPAAASGGAGRIVDQGGTGWNTLSLKGVYRPDGMRGTHIFDFGYQRAAYKLSTVERGTMDWQNGDPGARNQAFSGRTSIDSLYLQDTWKLSQDWKTVLGARFEHWEGRDGETANATTVVRHAKRSDNFVSPKAALAFQANEDWTLKASTGRAIRMPTVSELYQGGINNTGTLINNDPNLKPERSWTTELSAERLVGNSALRITAFFERNRDALYSQTNVLVTPNVTNVQNVDLIRTHGLETAWSNENVLVEGLDMQASLTWTDSRIKRNEKFPASAGKWQPRIPEWRASAVATYRVNDKLSATLAARYSGKQYSTLDNTDINGFAYQGASKYFTVDARLRYRIDKHWSAAFGIDNANNYKYWNFHPYPQRSYSAEVKFDW